MERNFSLDFLLLGKVNSFVILSVRRRIAVQLSLQEQKLEVLFSFLVLLCFADSAAKMRYANSLESLDAVSTSIQQARAQSSQPMHHNQYHLEPTKTKLSRNEYHQPTR